METEKVASATPDSSDAISADSVEESVTVDPLFTEPVVTEIDEANLSDFSVPNWFGLLMEQLEDEPVSEPGPEPVVSRYNKIEPSLVELNEAQRLIRG